jgi:outer membrane protein OmpA-like peptidoglycan-associated protein
MNSKSVHTLLKVSMALLLFFSRSNVWGQYGFDTLSVYFHIGSAHIEDEYKEVLDSLAQIIVSKDQRICIYGYADYLGQEAPNQTLSDRRAFAVRDYLVTNHKFDTQFLLSCTGVGMIAEKKEGENGNSDNRRVDLYLKRFKPHDVANISRIAQNNFSDSPLSQLDTNETIVLKNINFYPSSHLPLPESMPALEELVTLLLDEPTMHIKIEGHICCLNDGNDALDLETGKMNLSEARAQYIYHYLIREGGIEASRLSYEGFGKTRPLVKFELSEAEANMNRRVEIRVLAK